jgi:hypothetical protein
MAYVFNKTGQKGLRDLLALVEVEFSQEDLERYTEMLTDAGLGDTAAIVLEAAKTAVPSNILWCQYASEDRCNYQSWKASRQRRHRILNRTNQV